MSSETTTGVSPLPMAITRCRPSRPASTVMMPSHGSPLVPSAITNITPRTTDASTITAFSAWRASSSNGRLPMLPRSFRNAMIEPVKVTAPTRTPMDPPKDAVARCMRHHRAANLREVHPSPRHRRQIVRKADQHRGQADEAVKHRDQLGIAVIATRDASVAPIAQPIAITRPSSPRELPDTEVPIAHDERGKRRHDGHSHTDDAPRVALPCGFRDESPETEDEENAGRKPGRAKWPEQLQ